MRVRQPALAKLRTPSISCSTLLGTIQIPQIEKASPIAELSTEAIGGEMVEGIVKECCDGVFGGSTHGSTSIYASRGSQDVCGSTTPLGKGTAARPRCIPQAVARTIGIEPYPRHPTVASVDHARETSLSLHPSPKGRFVAPMNPLAGLGAFPLHRHRTMDKRFGRLSTTRGNLQAPRDPMANPTRIGCRHLLVAGPRRGASAAPRPAPCFRA